MKLLVQLTIIVSAALLNGCAVYTPMQCAAPAIDGKNQGELSGSTYLNGRVEVAGTYSPAAHVLLRAAYSNRNDDTIYGRSRYNIGSQYDLGFGAYGRAWPGWTVGGLAGVGQGQSLTGISRDDGLRGFTTRRYEARFDKVYGEAYATYKASDETSFGAAYRVTQVNFTRLTEGGVPLDLPRMVRSEPMLFMRVRPRFGALEIRPLQLQWAVGWSSTFGYDERGAPPIADVKQGRGYMTLTVSILPHYFFQTPRPAALGR